MTELTPVGRARSFLFVPATRPDRFAKAITSGADQVVIDLEDAVEESAKDDARGGLATWLDQTTTAVVVRVNPANTPFGIVDIDMLRGLRTRAGLAAVALPKTEHRDQVAAVREAVGPHVPILPIVETALGLDSVRSIVRAPGVERIISGNLDLALDLRVDFTDETVVRAVKLPLVVASRAAGLCPPVDGPSTELGDADIVLNSARAARAEGFGAKICIHPVQVAPVHRGFAPSPDEVEWARSIIDAARSRHEGAFQVSGRMVDRPVIDWAEDVLRDHSNDTAREAKHVPPKR